MTGVPLRTKVMIMIRPLGVTWLVAVLAGCGADDFECSIGQLTGTWRQSYVELDGNCGPIPAETILFTIPAAEDPPGCVFNSRQTTPDMCETSTDFACPTADGQGTQAWVVQMEQVAAGRLEGSGTAQLTHPSANCRSTYDIVLREL